MADLRILEESGLGTELKRFEVEVDDFLRPEAILEKIK